ncbi:MAG: ferrochelatase [Actinobacteria bacterium]|nr:ferrochelatase [Actinomycetota bacterium]
MTYDAILLAGFGGPRKPEDVVPFLRNVTAGKGIPDERLAEVGEHYHLFGGRSPINELTEALRDALVDALRAEGIDLPVIVGNRNWDPYTLDALRAIVDGGGRRVLTVITAAYSSYSGCRQYREDIAAQVQKLGIPLQVEKVRAYFNTPGFVEANVDAVVAAFRKSEDAGHLEADLVFVTHSIPNAMEASSGVARPASYAGQHEEVARLVAAGAGEVLGRDLPWRLVYCSRSGPPQVPWLEPDVNDALEDMAEAGTRAVVLSPIGFIADHMEVIYDLDTEAAATARELGLGFMRAATAGTHPAFVAGLVQVVKERMGLVEPAVVGDLPAWEPVCAENCCLMPQRPSGHGGHGGPGGYGAGVGR